MTPTVVIVPGLRDHIAHHWQTLLEAKLPKVVTVPRLTPGTLSRAVWITTLEQTLAKVAGPIIFVAHSAGVMITVHWAQTYFRPILGALLATPPDFENPLPEGYPTVEQLKTHGWLPTPRARLPFTSIVAASTNDPLARYERAAELASAWGSAHVRREDAALDDRVRARGLDRRRARCGPVSLPSPRTPPIGVAAPAASGRGCC